MSAHPPLGVVAILPAQPVVAMGRKRRRAGNFLCGGAPAAPYGRGSIRGWGREIHFGVVQDQVFQMDEFAGEPKRGAGVGKMRAGAKTVADGAGAQPLVEAGKGVLGFGDRRHEDFVEAR